jgi:hypothetical protein
MLLTALIPPSGENDAQPPTVAAKNTDATSARCARACKRAVVERIVCADHDERVIASKLSDESLPIKAF